MRILVAIFFLITPILAYAQLNLKDLFQTASTLRPGFEFKISDDNDFENAPTHTLNEHWQRIFSNVTNLKIVGKISLGGGKFAYVTSQSFEFANLGGGKRISAWILNPDYTYKQEIVLAEDSNWLNSTPSKIKIESKLNANSVTITEQGFDNNESLTHSNTFTLGIQATGGFVKL